MVEERENKGEGEQGKRGRERQRGMWKGQGRTWRKQRGAAPPQKNWWDGWNGVGETNPTERDPTTEREKVPGGTLGSS